MKKKGVVAALVSLGVGVVALVFIQSGTKKHPWSWNEDFKTSFIETCVVDMNREFEGRKKGKIDFSAYSDKYCNCISNAIEEAKVVPMSYRELRFPDEDYTEIATKSIESYLNSRNGERDLTRCVSDAKKKAST